MSKDQYRFLLFTRNARLTTAIQTALEDLAGDLIQVESVSFLATLLEREHEGDLVLVDLDLNAAQLEEAVGVLDGHRDRAVVVLGDASTEPWAQVSRGASLEANLTPPFSAKRLRPLVERLLHTGLYLNSRLVGKTPAMQELRDQILLHAGRPTAMLQATVLITGESGTGKDVVAQALHDLSPRRDGPFRPINCGAITENLLENELFGHERGAFTDAKTQSKGIFEQADKGTVFLDEIGEMTPAAQVRLLRVLEERQVTRVGGERAIPVDVRIVAATNKDLQQAVAHGEFRQDLYYRIRGVQLRLPLLRERAADIPLLLQYYIGRSTRETGVAFAGFSPAAMDLLMDYDWPGNVRELRNLVDLMVLGDRRQPVEPADLYPHLERPATTNAYLPVVTGKSPEQSERELIIYTLLELKREVGQLRALLEEHVSSGGRAAPARPLYRLEEPVFAQTEPIEEEIIQTASATPVLDRKAREKEAIEQALRQAGGHREKAAELLGISQRTLYRKLNEYDIGDEP
ncbi:MAG: AAA domain-containing protein [Candidatus Latescibacteria bacterium]|nr:AAA domain-containing protein [Candidatus Latescibacterota bacterium]